MARGDDPLAELETNEPGPLYLLYGKEPFLVDRAVDVLRRRVLDPRTRDFNYELLHGKEMTAQRVLSAARTLPMMAKRRLILVRDVDEAKADELNGLIGYLGKPCAETCLVLTAEKADQRLKFISAFKKAGQMLKLDPLYERQLPGFVHGEAIRAGVRIEPAAAQLICDEIGAEVGQLADAVERLAVYVGDKKRIGVEDVEEVVATTRQRTVFELCDAIGHRRRDRALVIAASMTAARESGVRVVSMLARHVRQLATARALLGQRLGKMDLAQALGVPPFFVDNIADQARRLDGAVIGRMHDALFRADFDFKSSRIADERILERLVLELHTAMTLLARLMLTCGWLLAACSQIGGQSCPVLGETVDEFGACPCIATGAAPENGVCYCETDGDCGAGHCSNNGCFASNIAIGEACGVAGDCTSGICSNGKCSGPLADGAECGADSDCQSGICDGSEHSCGKQPDNYSCTRDIECTGGICFNAMSCGAVGLEMICYRDRDCLSGICVFIAGGAVGNCGPFGNGARCEQARDCDSSLCDGGFCGSALGGACTTDGDCQGAPFICYMHVCANLQADGAACTRPQDCATGLCVNAKCGKAAAGEACTSDGECASGLCSNATICGAQPNGSGCGRDADCSSGWCDTPSCAAKLADGQPCSGNDACISTLCFNNACQEYVANGHPCTAGVECHSGVCNGGVCTCVGGGSEVDNTARCCAGSGTALTDCNDPLNACLTENDCACTDAECNPECCGNPDGNYYCDSAAGKSCTLGGECDPGLVCGGSGICCGVAGSVTSQCCSGISTGGGGCACSQRATACQAGAECCSGVCATGACSCAGTNSVCSGNQLCCSGVCDMASGKCACSTANVVCGGDGECCSGSCVTGHCACVITGDTCVHGSDCCTGSCGAGKCQCAPTGSSCSTNNLCCSGTCNLGSCV